MDLQKDMLPGAGWVSKKRIYLIRPDRNTVAVEDINIATLFLCKRYRKVDGKIDKEFAPGSYQGIALGKLTSTGKRIYLFEIAGNIAEFEQAKLLFHGGFLRIDPRDFIEKKNYLIDRLKEAEFEAARIARLKRDEHQKRDNT